MGWWSWDANLATAVPVNPYTPIPPAAVVSASYLGHSWQTQLSHTPLPQQNILPGPLAVAHPFQPHVSGPLLEHSFILYPALLLLLARSLPFLFSWGLDLVRSRSHPISVVQPSLPIASRPRLSLAIARVSAQPTFTFALPSLGTVSSSLSATT